MREGWLLIFGVVVAGLRQMTMNPGKSEDCVVIPVQPCISELHGEPFDKVFVDFLDNRIVELENGAAPSADNISIFGETNDIDDLSIPTIVFDWNTRGKLSLHKAASPADLFIAPSSHRLRESRQLAEVHGIDLPQEQAA